MKITVMVSGILLSPFHIAKVAKRGRHRGRGRSWVGCCGGLSHVGTGDNTSEVGLKGATAYYSRAYPSPLSLPPPGSQPQWLRGFVLFPPPPLILPSSAPLSYSHHAGGTYGGTG